MYVSLLRVCCKRSLLRLRCKRSRHATSCHATSDPERGSPAPHVATHLLPLRLNPCLVLSLLLLYIQGVLQRLVLHSKGALHALEVQIFPQVLHGLRVQCMLLPPGPSFAAPDMRVQLELVLPLLHLRALLQRDIVTVQMCRASAP